MSKNSLSTNQELFKGEYLLSENGNYKAVFQEDGNFVIYGWKPVWATATNGKNPSRIILQGDLNLVMYTQDNKAVWSSGNCDPLSSHVMRLTLNNNGQLIVTNDGKQIWSSQ